MKYIFLAIFLFLLLMSGVAWKISPSADPSGRKVIVWTSDDNPRRRNQIALFNQLHPDYELRLDAANAGLDKVITQSLAGVGPDVFDVHDGGTIGLLADAGMLYDVTDQLAARGIHLNQIWPVARPAVSINGRIYGIPCNVSTTAVWYHRDLLDAAGVAYPPEKGWKWDDFIATAQKLTKHDANGRITQFGVMGLVWTDLLLTNGGRILTPDGRRCVVDSPQAADALQKWLDLQFKYKVSPSPTEEASMSTQGGWGSGVITLFQEKRAAMAFGGRWWLCILRDVKDDNGNFPFNFGVAEPPTTRIRRFSGTTRIAYVNALSPNRDRAVEFLTYLMSDEYSDVINRDADALPPRMDASERPAFFNDPYHGRDGGASPVWKSMAMEGIAVERSPYITTQEINNLIGRQVDLARAGNKSPQNALADAARRINETIAQNLAREPKLRERFENGDTSPVYDNFMDSPTGSP